MKKNKILDLKYLVIMIAIILLSTGCALFDKAKDNPTVSIYVAQLPMNDFINKHGGSTYTAVTLDLNADDGDEFYKISETAKSDYKKYDFKCKTEQCEIDRYTRDYLVIKESDNISYLYDITKGELIYTLPQGKKATEFATVLSRDSYDETIGLIMNGRDFYHIKKEQITFKSDEKYFSYEGSNWGNIAYGNTAIVKIGSISSGGEKYGAINVESGEIIVPIEYEYYKANDCDDWAGICEKYSRVIYFTNSRYRNANDIPFYSTENDIVYYAFEIDSGKQLFNGVGYKYVVATPDNGGKAIVIQDDNFKLIDFDNNLIKELGEAPKDIDYYYGCKQNDGDLCIKTVDKDNKSEKYVYNFTSQSFSRKEN